MNKWFPNVGTLYAAQEFLRIASKEPCTLRSHFLAANHYIIGLPRIDVVKLCDMAGWIVSPANNAEEIPIAPTKLGQQIATESSPDKALRLQLEHCIKELKPSWRTIVTKGINFSQNYLPSPIKQAFREAQLFDPSAEDVRTWWDDMLAFLGPLAEVTNLITGRKAEKLTLQYENQRTGLTPEWVAIRDNSAGYDVLSFTTSDAPKRLRIEVKATTVGIQGTIHITEIEWNVANSSGCHLFHVWLLDDEENPILHVVPTERIAQHIADNKGDGKWDVIRIPVAAIISTDPCSKPTSVPRGN